MIERQRQTIQSPSSGEYSASGGKETLYQSAFESLEAFTVRGHEEISSLCDLTTAMRGIPESLLKLAESIKGRAATQGGEYEGLSYYEPNHVMESPQCIIGNIATPDNDLSIMLSWDAQKLRISKVKHEKSGIRYLYSVNIPCKAAPEEKPIIELIEASTFEGETNLNHKGNERIKAYYGYISNLKQGIRDLFDILPCQ